MIQGRMLEGKVIIGFIFSREILLDYNIYLYAISGKSSYLHKLFNTDCESIVTSDLKGNETYNLNLYPSYTAMYKATKASGIKVSHLNKYVLKKRLLNDEKFNRVMTSDEFEEYVDSFIKTNQMFKRNMKNFRDAFEKVWNGGTFRIDEFHCVSYNPIDKVYTSYIKSMSGYITTRKSRVYEDTKPDDVALEHFIQSVKHIWRFE